METVLSYYKRAYDPLRPLVCFDERPCFLIGDRVEGLEMCAGKPKREDYAYTKHGSCSLLAAIEPHTGRRFAHLKKQRRKTEFAHFMMHLAQQYPQAEVITVVMDNLNTHCKSAFYQNFDAETAQWLAQRFAFIYTPKKASWLNMIEIEFSALARQCLNRRIPTREKIETEVNAFFSHRARKKVKIKWQFTTQQARKTFNSHYTKVNPINCKYN